MSKSRIVVYDAEIKKAILSKGETRIPGIQYCEGWTDFHGMGVSVLCAWDSKYNIYRVFDDKNMHKFDRLVQKADFLVGYQSLKFDNPLIQAVWRIRMPEEKVFDLKEVLMGSESEAILNDYKIILLKALSLNRMANANGLYTKLMHGAMAPVLWQQGHIAEVTNYCFHDVELVVDLLKMAVNGTLVSSHTMSVYKDLNIPSPICEALTEVHNG